MRRDYPFLTHNVIPNLDGEIVGGRGAVFYLRTGRKILDFSSQTGNLSLGHNHSGLIRVAKRQMSRFSYNSSRIASGVFMDLSKRLLKVSHPSLNRVNLKLTNGSEAVESAIKRARKATGKNQIITFYGSHHGETTETLRASGKNLGLLQNRNYWYLHPDDRAIEEFKNLAIEGHDIAALVVEPVMVNAGVIIHPIKRLKKLRALCSRHKIALIFDEVQTAFGWLGVIFAYELVEVIPDMVAVGKALAPGFPLAALLLNEKYDVLDYGWDEFTYGGHPISCAVALANLEILQKSDFRVKQKSELLRKLLRRYRARGLGLIWGVEAARRYKARLVYQECFKQGLLLRLSGDERTLIFKPPLVVSQEQIRQAMAIFERAWSKKD